FIGPPLRQAFATLLETSDRDLIERAVALYREQYGETGLFENRVYDGVIQMLDACLEPRLGRWDPSPPAACSAHHTRPLAAAAPSRGARPPPRSSPPGRRRSTPIESCGGSSSSRTSPGSTEPSSRAGSITRLT